MNDSTDEKGAGVKFPPPLLILILTLIAYAFDFLFPLPIITGSSMWFSGGIVIVIAFLLVAIAIFQFRQAKTHVEPWKSTSSIIQSGVYRYSRNPIYLAFCIVTAGIGMVLNSWWVVGVILPLMFLLRHLVIAREEAYLEKKFGDEYINYKNSVRRWI